MKKLYIIIVLVILSCKLFAQVQRARTPAPLPPPLPVREVSGIIKDESGQTIIGAVVTLKSAVDTVSTATNEDGIFVFKNIKKAAFNVTATSIGSETFVKKYLNSDIVKRIVLDPITLKNKANELNEVKINGAPSIVYKTDTVEYRASDYKVRENATIDELLKKMEGMEVGNDGSLIHQGENVVKAKLNGKEFSGGSVAQAIKNLPADIVEKIQIVDDYGDQAARTGIKEGTPQKILNITTKPDKSVGTIGRATAQVGNNDRYNFQLSGQRINANQVINIIGNINKSVTGIGGGSPGVTQSGDPTISYRDQWSKKVQINSNFRYNFDNNNSTTQQYGTDPSTLGISYFKQNGSNANSSRGYSGSFQIEVQADSLNFLQISPSFNRSTSNNSNENTRDQSDFFHDVIDTTISRFQHRLSIGSSSSSSDNKSYGVNALWVHLFKKPKRNISINMGVSRNDSESNGGSDRIFRYFQDSTQNIPLPKLDSAANVLTRRINKNTSYSGTITYTEPLSLYSLLEFRSEFSHSTNNSRATQDTVMHDAISNTDITKELINRRNIYDFTVNQSRFTTSYRYTGLKVNFSIGATAIPYNLTGQKLDIATQQYASSSRSTFRIVPSFRFAYQWSRTQRFQITYTGANVQPQFQQIQPFTDVSNPNNIVIGNPDLNPAFNHSINANYNNYIANSKLNFSFSAFANRTDNRITTNSSNVSVTTIKGTDTIRRNVNYQRFINLDGSHSYGGGYNISKQLDDRRYNLSLNGNISYNYNTAVSNSILYHTTVWRFNERFGPRISPNDNIEINPYVAYDVTRTFSTAGRGNYTIYKRTSMAIDGRVYFLKTFQVNYSASKNFVSGIQNASNPLVVNAGFQKEFLPRKNLVVTFNVYDLLHQNNFLQQDVASDGGVTNTTSSSLSRYFMFGVRYSMQKWSGRPKRNGREMQRRGDGSFIY